MAWDDVKGGVVLAPSLFGGGAPATFALRIPLPTANLFIVDGKFRI